MQFSNPGRRRAAAAIAALACAGALAACGGDDSDDGDIAELLITATGGKSAPSFEVDATELSAGATEITLDNQAEGDTDAQLIYTPEERSEEEVIDQLGNAIRGEAVEDWFQGGGGPGTTAAGETSAVTQELQPGTYYVVGNDQPEPPLASVTVTDEDGAELPEADGTVTAEEYSFSSEGLSAGANTIALENAGEEWHHFIAAKLVEGATIDDVEEFFGTEEGRPPFEEEPGSGGGIESTVIEGGTSQLVDVELEAGNYAFLCFIADKEGGPSHAEEGMIAAVEVTE